MLSPISLSPPPPSSLLPPPSHTAVVTAHPPANKARSHALRTPWPRRSVSMTTSTRSCTLLSNDYQPIGHIIEPTYTRCFIPTPNHDSIIVFFSLSSTNLWTKNIIILFYKLPASELLLYYYYSGLIYFCSCRM